MDTQLQGIIECPASERTAAGARMGMRDRLRRPLLVAFPVVLAAIGGACYLAEEPYVSTDNALVRAGKDSINARVSGQVADIAVEDNQRVRKGQLLFRIDPAPYQISVDEAEARRASARLRIGTLKATYRQQLAELRSAQETASLAERELRRKKALVSAEFTSRAAYERAETDLTVARERVAAVEQQIANTIVTLDGDPDKEVDRHPIVREAKAQLDRAELDLSYVEVVAPDDGIVTKVDDLRVGDFVQPGHAVFALISSQHLWIEANFRETDLTHMRPGQAATIAVDTYPDRTFTAHVASLSPGTGSDFAVLPPENATGNWVKVVQRVPVRLELDEVDPSRPLFSGISVTARIDTGHRNGWWRRLRALLGQEAAQ